MVFTHYILKDLGNPKDYYAYIVNSNFKRGQLDNITKISELPAVMAVTKSDLVPRKGPGANYEEWSKYPIPQGTSLECFFEENGYCFVEYQFNGKKNVEKMRAWIPKDAVDFDTDQELTSP